MGHLQQAGTNTTSWILYVVLGLVVLALIIWALFRRVKRMEVDALAEPPTTPRKERREDDLTKIEGIGPKVAEVLKGAGITSFESLSKANAAKIQDLLKGAGLQMMNPEGWMEQARLAAQGDWEELQKLQEELVGGRRK
jgi:DNA polymerase/3'-5' exonuclease PolX